MKFLRLTPPLIAAFTGFFLVSCGSNPFTKKPETQAPQQTAEGEPVNPHPVGSYEHFKFASYPGTTRTWKNDELLASANPADTSVLVDLSTQRGFLFVGESLDFRITEKIKEKRSNLYGKILDANGNTVKASADSRKDSPPPGGKFLGASMPYWMRLTNSGIGMHQGIVSRRYASHGCIRTHATAVPTVFEKTKVGTLVRITE